MDIHLIMKRLILILFVILTVSFQEDESFKAERKKMVNNQMIARGIKDASVIEAFNNVPRHKFVAEVLKSVAYSDSPLQIGYGQTISQPYIVAFMTEVIKPKKDFKVLEIGTGSGYQAAILAEIVDSVYTIEIIKELWYSSKKDCKI